MTIDAIGTQRKIADMIIKKDADYILALKKNQSELLEIITTFPIDETIHPIHPSFEADRAS